MMGEGVSLTFWGAMFIVFAMMLAFLMSLRTRPDPRRGPWAGLGNALLSSDPLQRARIWRYLFGASNHAFGLLALNYGSQRGVVDVAACQYLTWVAVSVVAAGYVVLRSGWNHRLADPAMLEAQMWGGIVLLGWGYLIGGPGAPSP